MNDESRLQSPGAHETPITREVDSIEAAYITLGSVAQVLHCLVSTDAHDEDVRSSLACLSEQITEGIDKIEAATVRIRRSAEGQPQPVRSVVDTVRPVPDSGLLDFEEPLIMAKGQAAALHDALAARGDEELIGAAWALERQVEGLFRSWDEKVEARRLEKERAAS